MKEDIVHKTRDFNVNEFIHLILSYRMYFVYLLIIIKLRNYNYRIGH